MKLTAYLLNILSLSDKCLQSSRGFRNTLTFLTCCACHWLTESKAPRCVLPFMWPAPCPLLRPAWAAAASDHHFHSCVLALAISFSFSLRDITFQFNPVSSTFLAVLLFQNLSVSLSFSPAASASCRDISNELSIPFWCPITWISHLIFSPSDT